MKNIEVRYALQSDYDAILKMEEEYFTRPHSLSQLRDEDILVAADDEVLGYIGIRKVLDEGYISNICVRGDVRRQGIADMLIWKLVDEYNDLSFVTLEVRKSNEAAIALYKKHGFEIAGEMHNYYTAPKEDAIIMTLRFYKN